MKMKMMFVLLFALLLSFASTALAYNAVHVIAVGTDAAGVTYVLTTGGNTACAYTRAYTDSEGRSGCWAPNDGYKRYVLAQQRPTAAFRLLPYSQSVACPPDTATAEQCLAN